ncbi:ribosome maturation factor RimM [Elioraea rosea]|uniref:ribosome maturation factor RimM n=1 Tax=Elioraea rosea TaxID=2492390 RepID=UPI0011853021|nr:ribosome maturation factor RimM [Elioraea rosea]
MSPTRVLMGVIGRPHGVRGLVRVQSFTAEPTDIAAYGPLWDEAAGRNFLLSVVTPGEMPVVRIDGVADREAAARLTGTKLYVERAVLPETEEDEYYLADLVGCEAVDVSGAPVGRVAAVHDHGAGAFLEIPREAGPALLLPFTRAAVPVVDLAARRVTVAPPAEEIVPPSAEGSGEGAAA